MLDISAVKGYQYILHLAPEVEKFSQHTALADIYACGVTLYRLVNGDSYLPSVTPSEARRLATKGEFPDRSYYRGFVPAAFKKVINRAMEVDPAARYQSAEEMRRALEKVQISVDWDENVFAGGKQWLGSAGDIRVLVERMKGSDGSWSVTVKKGKEGKNMRRDNSMCSSGLSEGQAMRSAYRVLQRFTSGKVK